MAWIHGQIHTFSTFFLEILKNYPHLLIDFSILPKINQYLQKLILRTLSSIWTKKFKEKIFLQKIIRINAEKIVFLLSNLVQIY